MSLLIKNGIVVTMAANREIIWNGAVFIEDERIKTVGKSIDLEAKYGEDANRIIDATGKIILPGFINLHAHGVLIILRGQAEDEETVVQVVYTKMFPIEEIMTGEDCYQISKLAYVELLKFGSTTVVDSGGSMQDVAQAASDTGIRVYLHDTIIDANAMKIKDGIYEYIPEIGEATLNKSLELIEKWHMKDGGRIRCMLGPHATDTCSPELLKRVREVADQYGIGITIHLAQSKMEVKQIKKKYGKTPIGYLESVGILGPDFIGAHATFLEHSDLVLLAKYGANISHNAVINAKRGYIAPVADMQKAGLNVGLGTDNMAADMIEVMRVGQMVSRIKTGIAHEPKPEKMLEMATINGAKALGVEKELGSIEGGKIADIILINCNKPHYIPLLKPNIVANLIHTGLSSDIDTVLVGGKVVVEGGQYIVEDEQEIIKQAQKTSEQVWKKWSEK